MPREPRDRLAELGRASRARGNAPAAELWLTRPVRAKRRAVVAAALFLCLAGVWSTLVFASFDRHDREAAETFDSSRAGAEMLTAMLDQETGLRGYVASGDRRFLQPYWAGREHFRGAIRAARRPLAADDSALASLREQGAIAARWEGLAGSLIAHVRRHGAVRLSLGSALKRKSVMDQFRDANARFQSLLARRGAHERAATRSRAVAALIGLTVLLGALAVAVLFLIRRRERRSDARLRALVHNSLDLLMVLDQQSTILYVSPAIELMLGHRPGYLLGRSFADLLHPDDARDLLARYAKALDIPGVSEGAAVCRLLHVDGSYRWVENAFNNLLADPDIRGVVVNSRDVTEREKLAEALRHQAFHDRLTGLANRALFDDRLTHALERRVVSDERVCVLLVDLDDFKAVNDSLGHLAGDEVLAEAARRLQGAARAVDTVARVGGDEFAVLIDEEADDGGELLAMRILEVMATPVRIDGQALTIGASIGVARGAAPDVAEDILRRADLALYEAKEDGKRRVAVYRDDLAASAEDQVASRPSLSDAG